MGFGQSTVVDNSMPDEDKTLFHKAMAGVKPLTTQKKRAPIIKDKPARIRVQHPIKDHIPAPRVYLSDQYTDPVTPESVLSYASQGLPARRFKQLRSGQITYQARLDLHGLKPEQAKMILCDFIQQQCRCQHRCVLIIHGKGGHQGQAPVIKNLVYHWLKQLPQIAGFHSALGRDGGSGALYLLLRSGQTEYDMTS